MSSLSASFGEVSRRASGNAKLVVAQIAVVLEAIMNLCGFTEAALADRALGPAQMLKARTATVIRPKPLDQFNKVDILWN